MIAAAQPAPSSLPPEIIATARRGWRLFPVRARDKKPPLVRDWPTVATCDLEQLGAWSRDFPGCNWGLACGPESGVYALDVDGEPGIKTVGEWEARGWILPLTRQHITPRGHHLLYAWPRGFNFTISGGKLGPGIDERGDHGYILFPPSLHPSGHRYICADEARPLAEMPGWLIALHERPTPSIAIPQTVAVGQRTTGLTKDIGAMLRRKMPVAEIEVATLAINRVRNVPPLQESKVIQTVRDMARRYPHETHETPSSLSIKAAQDVTMKERKWIIPALLPDATLSALVGLPGVGKTTVALSICAAISRGDVPIVGTGRAPANTFYLSNEDDESTLVTRFLELGGDRSKLFIEDAETPMMCGIGDIASLETKMQELHPGIVFIDSLGTHKPTKSDLNSHGDMAGLLAPLRLLAERQGCAIVLVHHLNKGQNADPNARIMGSTAIQSTCRAVLMVGPSPDDPDRNMVAVSKSNLASKRGAGYFYQVEPIFQWGEQTDVSASTMLQGANVAKTAGERFLKDALQHGPVLLSKILADADAARFPKTTIYNAAARLGVTKTTSGFGREKKAAWSLPFANNPTPSHTSGIIGTNGTIGTNGRGDSPTQNPNFPNNPNNPTVSTREWTNAGGFLDHETGRA